MASWNELREYVEGKYKIADRADGMLKLLFGVEGDRSQIVLVARISNNNTGEEWVGISSPIGSVDSVDLAEAARLAFNVLCGGIVIIGDMVYLHHAAPLVNLDTNEFERPLSILVGQADKIEKALTGNDNF